MKNYRPKENETILSYMFRIINNPSFIRIPVRKLRKNLKLIDNEADLDTVIIKMNQLLDNYEIIKTTIPGDRKQYVVLRRIVESIEKEPFIPNDNLLKQRKIEFQNPRVVLQVKEYTNPINMDKQLDVKQTQIGLNNALADKEKNLQKLNTDNYDEILNKINKGVLTYKVSKLSKEERYTILIKFYEASDTTHSFNVFKQSYLNFLNDTLLHDNIFNQRLLKFLKNEIKKQDNF